MKNNTIENITEYAKNATAIEEPAEYSTGVKVGWTAPAKWWNWLMNAFSRRLGETYETVKSIHEEIKNAVGGTLDENSNTQLKNAIDGLGRVQEVNGKLPDANGKVDVFAEDILGYAMVKEASGKYTSSVSGGWDTPAVLSDGTLVAGSSNSSNTGIIYSTDKGVTWTASSQASGDWNITAVLPDGTLVAGSDSSNTGIIYSTDKGVTWTASSQTSGNWNTPAVLSDGTLVAGSDSSAGIIYSTDKGITWTASSLTSGSWNTPAVLSDGTVIVSNRKDFYGIFWIILLAPAPNLEQVKNSAANFMLVVAVSTALPKSTKVLFVSQGQYAMTLDTKNIYQASVSGDNISWTLVTSL